MVALALFAEVVRKEHVAADALEHVLGGATDAPLCCRERDAEHLGDLGELHARQAVQHEGDAIVRADLIEDPAELNQRRLRLGIVVARASLDFIGGPGELVEKGTPLALPDLPTDRVEGDRDDVASQPVGRPNLLGGFEEADEDVADEVLDFCLRPQGPGQQTEDETVELVEGSPLPIRRAGPDGGEQITLFRRRGPFGRG